jgi:hypothetical protein
VRLREVTARACVARLLIARGACNARPLFRRRQLESAYHTIAHVRGLFECDGKVKLYQIIVAYKLEFHLKQF